MKKWMSNWKSIWVVVLTAVFVTACSSEPEDKTNPYLASIPNDSLIVYASLEPYPNQQAIDHFSDIFKLMNPELLAEPVNLLMQELPRSSDRFLLEFVTSNIETLQRTGSYLDIWGYPEHGHYAIYTVDGVPVIKMQLANRDSFVDMIKKVEKKVQHQSHPVTVNNYEVRYYPLTDHTASIQNNLIIAVSDNTLTISYDLQEFPGLIKTILSDEPVPNPFDSNRLVEIQKQYGFDPYKISLYQPQQFYDGLYNDGNKQVRSFLYLLDDFIPQLAYLDEQRCKDELQTVIKRWGDVVAGETYTKLESGQEVYTYREIYTFNDPQWKQQLQSLQGSMPAYVAAQDSIISLSVGINLDKVDTQALRGSGCGLISNTGSDLIHDEIIYAASSFLGKTTRGLAVTLYDFGFDLESRSVITELDAIITIRSSDTGSIMELVKSFGFNKIDTSSNERQQLDIPFLPFAIYIQQLDEYVVAFAGEKSQKAAMSLSGETTELVAFSYVYLDTQRLMTSIKNSLSDKEFSAANMFISMYFSELFDSTIKIEYTEKTDETGLLNVLKLLI